LPGKTGKIDVKYNMNLGPIRKTITVESNAVNVDEGRVAIKIKGEVIQKPIENLLEKKKTSPMMQ
jgi:carbon monoxide dehydrogenase subunit G